MTMEYFLIIIIIILAYLLYKSKKNNGEDFVGTANKYGKAFKDAAHTFQDTLNKDSSIYSSFISEIADFIERHNVATQGLILKNAVRYKEDICDKDSDYFGMSHYFQNYSSQEMKSFFSNPNELENTKADEILKSYKNAYLERKKQISKMPQGMGATQLGNYELIGFSVWLASSSAIIYEDLFPDSLEIWKILYPLIKDEGVNENNIPDIYLQKLK